MDGSALERCVRDGAASFEPGELAYLALTSMVERPLLDQISYQLHRRAEPLGGAVAREWRIPGAKSRARADIAVLIRGKPVLLLEGKAMYTLASLRNRGMNRKFVDRMQSDLDRLESAHLNGADVYMVMFAANPRSSVPEKLQPFVKKANAINSALPKVGDHGELARHTDDRMTALTVPSRLASRGTVDAGQAYGVGVDLMWWLFGPFSAPDHLQLGAAGHGVEPDPQQLDGSSSASGE